MMKHIGLRIPLALSVVIGLTACSEYQSGTAEVGVELVVPVLTEDERTPLQRSQTLTRRQRSDPREVRRLLKESNAKWLEEQKRLDVEQAARWKATREAERKDYVWPPRSRSLPPARAGSELLDRTAQRAQCEAALNRAEDSARRYQELFAQGATEKGRHGLSQPNKRTNRQTATNRTTGRSVTVYMGDKLGRAKADEHVSCERALRSRKYPMAAKTCADYKNKIEEANREADRARRCARAARR